MISFLHRHVAGIELLDDGPAYRRFRVRPQPGGGLSWAKAAHDSPYGPIEVAWSRTADAEIDIEVRVPPGTSAELVLPDGSTCELAAGRHRTVSRTPRRLADQTMTPCAEDRNPKSMRRPPADSVVEPELKIIRSLTRLVV